MFELSCFSPPRSRSRHQVGQRRDRRPPNTGCARDAAPRFPRDQRQSFSRASKKSPTQRRRRAKQQITAPSLVAGRAPGQTIEMALVIAFLQLRPDAVRHIGHHVLRVPHRRASCRWTTGDSALRLPRAPAFGSPSSWRRGRGARGDRAPVWMTPGETSPPHPRLDLVADRHAIDEITQTTRRGRKRSTKTAEADRVPSVGL